MEVETNGTTGSYAGSFIAGLPGVTSNGSNKSMEPGKDAANTLALLFYHMRFDFVASVVYRVIMSYGEVYEH